MEFLPCPFCGKADCEPQGSQDGFPEMPPCILEAHNWDEVGAKWNTRPIEAALRSRIEEQAARIAELDEEADRLTMNLRFYRETLEGCGFKMEWDADRRKHILIRHGTTYTHPTASRGGQP